MALTNDEKAIAAKVLDMMMEPSEHVYGACHRDLPRGLPSWETWTEEMRALLRPSIRESWRQRITAFAEEQGIALRGVDSPSDIKP